MNINRLLQLAVEHNASDLHLAPNHCPIMRINGDLHFLREEPVLTSHEIQKIFHDILSKDQQLIFAAKMEYDFAYTLPNIARFRVNAFHQAAGVAAVFRVIPETVPTLDQLEMPPVFKKLLSLPNGLILVTGSTGSGKSTTLAAMIEEINHTQSAHIITIEDPIEFTYQSKNSLISQRQVHRDALSFEGALRAALREDPDVILVGEMRDLETIRLALTAAETGHLVMGTLHTTSAPRAISRIIDVFSASEKNIIRNLLSESLKAVICQTLIKSMKGGRIPAFEILLVTNAIHNLIREDNIAQMYNTMQTSAAMGMCTLEQYLAKLVEKQMISPMIAAECLNKNYL